MGVFLKAGFLEPDGCALLGLIFLRGLDGWMDGIYLAVFRIESGSTGVFGLDADGWVPF